MNCQDLSGNGNDGTIHGAVATAGKIGQALSFDGTDDYVDCGSGYSLDITDALTIEAWVKFVDLVGWKTLIHGTTTGGWGAAYWFSFGPGKQIRLNLEGTTDVRDDYTFSEAAVDTWYHLVGTYDGANGRIYIDGTEKHSWETTGSISITNINGALIGKTGNNAYYFNGLIDEVRIYNRALTAAEIKNHCDMEVGQFDF